MSTKLENSTTEDVNFDTSSFEPSQNIQQEATEEIQETKEEIIQEAQETKEEIIQEAQETKEEIIQEAQETKEEIIQEAQETKEEIIQETDKLIDLVKEEALNLLKDKLLSEIGSKEVDKQLLMKLLVIGMETIEKSQVKGKDQKKIVIDTLIQIIKLPNVKVPQEERLLLFLENDLDDIIDLVIDASKGKIDINKAEKHAVSLLKCLFTCLKKND